MTLGEKLKEARKQAGLSQEQLAEQLIISRSAIAKWEADLGTPDPDNLKILSQFCNVSIEDLLNEMKTLQQAQMPVIFFHNTYCGKSCDGCTDQERLNCSGCKIYSHSQPGGCAIARCCQDRQIEHCGACNYAQYCNKRQTRMQQPSQRRSNQIRHDELQMRNKATLQQAEIRLSVLSKYIPQLFKLTKTLIACTVLQMLLKRFIPHLEQWTLIPFFILHCLHAIVLLQMTTIHSRYRLAGLIALVVTPLTSLSKLLPQSSAFVFTILIAGSVLEIVGKRYEYTSHADMLEDLDSELAQKWRNLWNWQMLSYCCVLMSTLIARLTMLPLFILLLSCSALALAVISCFEWVYLSRSARIFLDYPVSALLNRVKHRLNNAK